MKNNENDLNQLQETFNRNTDAIQKTLIQLGKRIDALQ